MLLRTIWLLEALISRLEKVQLESDSKSQFHGFDPILKLFLVIWEILYLHHGLACFTLLPRVMRAVAPGLINHQKVLETNRNETCVKR